MLHDRDIPTILKTALAHGGEFAELYYEESRGTSIVAEDGKIEKVLAGADRGVGLRVISGLRTAYAYGNDTSPAALLELARTVRAAVKGEAAVRDIAIGPLQSGDAGVVLRDPESLPLAERVALVSRAEQAARGLDPRIRQASVVYRDSSVRSQVANSLGEFRENRRTATLFLAQVVAMDGAVMQTGYEPVAGCCGLELLERHDPVEIALTAGRRALLMLGARKAPGGVMPVVLAAEAGGTMVHEAVGHGLEGDLVHAGVSLYAGRIGQQVASPLVTVLDDATIVNARGSYAFDDEGTPSQRTILVQDGILTGYLYDRLTAMKAGCASTGNGRREGYHTRPIVRMSNTLIAPGQTPPEEVVRQASHGLLVKKMGGGQVNTVTGDFVFEVTEGYLVENGQVTEPVRGATLTGNGPEVLQRIVAVGSDLGFGIGTCGKDGQGVPVADAQPTLLISELTVGGAA